MPLSRRICGQRDSGFKKVFDMRVIKKDCSRCGAKQSVCLMRAWGPAFVACFMCEEVFYSYLVCA